MRQALVSALLCGVFLPAWSWAAGPAVFRPDPSGTRFDFETDEIQGTIRTDGAYHGVTRLVDKRTGRQVIDPRYSALNLFKLMSANQVMGQPRQTERTSGQVPSPPTPLPQAGEGSGRGTALRQAGEGSGGGAHPQAGEGRLGVEIRWPPSEGHKGELIARYEVRPPNAIDLIVTAKLQGSYPGYELFLSSYFDKNLRPYVYLKSRGNQPPERVLPTVNDVFRGTVLVFPRDALAARLCVDGRWERDERKTPVVQMCPVRHYAHCLAVQADPQGRLAVVLMSDPRCCYAISTRYHADNDVDRLTTYSAFDLSLFGDNAVPGVELHARVRLAVVQLDDEWKSVLEAYRVFLSTKGEGP